MSKLLELYMLEECGSHEPHMCQFGFVAHRGTSTAISLAHDVSAYCLMRGSPTYYVQPAHSVLFRKAIDVLPNHCWRIRVLWYSSMLVLIKWGNNLGSPIPVRRGARQGGLSSPFLFNLFYEDLVHELNSMLMG